MEKDKRMRFKLNKVPNAQVSDTTGDDTKNKSWSQKNYNDIIYNHAKKLF